jgi:hypothetical protein
MATKKPKEPLVRCGGTMTESAYLAWIRSALRSKSLRWPPRAEALKLARRAYKGPNRLQKWEYQCAMCGEWHLGKNVIVDHHPVAAGSILKWEDIGAFANNLYCETDNLRVLDKNCHDCHTLAERLNITMEEAFLRKRVLAVIKDKSSAQLLAYLKKHKYDGVAVSNSKKREAAVYEILKGEQGDSITN